MKTTLTNSPAADAQLEVWEWKESLYEEIKDLEKYARFEYIINKANNSKKRLLAKKAKLLTTT
jgi:hypothetical protein